MATTLLINLAPAALADAIQALEHYAERGYEDYAEQAATTDDYTDEDQAQNQAEWDQAQKLLDALKQAATQPV